MARKPLASTSESHDAGKMLKRDGDKMQRIAMPLSTLDIDLARDGKLVASWINEALTSLKTCGRRHRSNMFPIAL